MLRLFSVIALTGAVLAAPAIQSPLEAQSVPREAANAPREVRDRVQTLLRRPGTEQFDGTTRLTRTVRSDVIVSGGDLILEGRVHGDVVVLRGDLVLRPNAHITGDAIVYNGDIRGGQPGSVAGSTSVFRGSVATATRASPAAQPPGWGQEGARIVVWPGPTYNRVEGLPVMLGPVIQTGGDRPVRAEALAIWRSESAPGLMDRVGYTLKLEQGFSRTAGLRIGGGLHSVVQPVEAWGLSDLETSLAAVLLRSDDRDHYERRGWSAHARLAPRGASLDGAVEFRQEDHGIVGIASPWSLLRSDSPWRIQPLVAEGRFRLLSSEVRLHADRLRNPRRAGWAGRLQFTRSLDPAPPHPRLGEQPDPPQVDPVIEYHDGTRFTTAFLDLRRAHPLGPSASFHLRTVAAGALDGRALPPQFQHALGGPGSLPGHSRFAGDCGARAQDTVEPEDFSQRFFIAYGCDRVLLFQAEYRGPLGLDVGFSRDDDDWTDYVSRRVRNTGPQWAVFGNAGRGWALGDDARADSPWLYDAGVGLILDDLGLYLALPIRSEGRSPVLTARLDRRF